MKRWLLFILFIVFAANIFAETAPPLTVDQAFKLLVTSNGTKQLIAEWQIAPNYHLYRDKIKLYLNNSPLNKIALPPGIVKHDDVLGTYQIYKNTLKVIIPVSLHKQETQTLTIGYQGCADTGFCYPPITQQLAISASRDKSAPLTISFVQDKSSTNTANNVLSQHNIWLAAITFFGFGLLLSFTPCVLPMVPILSGLVLGQGKALTTRLAFGLSLSFVLSMAVTYAVAGILVSLAGSYLQGILQSPWSISLFSLVFISLALSLFGYYEIRLPTAWQERITAMTNNQQGGDYLGVIIMGCLSTLIVSPCVSAPLVGALSYISQTGNIFLGGSALFCMGLGMGVPLLVVGTYGTQLLPKVGPWMEHIKTFFGIVMLAMAIWLLSRIIPSKLALWLWGALCIGCAIYLKAFETVAERWQRYGKGLGIALFTYGIALGVSSFAGNTDPLSPLSLQANTATLPFNRITKLAELEQQLVNAKAQKKMLMLDYYADWCTTCKQMAATTFADPRVQAALKDFVLVQADVTKNTANTQALQKRYDVLAPPTILFFDSKGNEFSQDRITGESAPDEFLARLQQVLAKNS